MFEKLILIYSPKLKITHKNQFGFRQKTSCNHALFALKENILNYTKNQSGIKIVSLDAEIAFDKVRRDGLFFKLINKMDYTFWYILKIYYDSSIGTIELDLDIFSSTFSISVRVKQGRILSPSLFPILIDDLIHECTDENIDTEFKNMNLSIIVYADDIILLSSVDSRHQKLLNICEVYSKNWMSIILRLLNQTLLSLVNNFL